MLTVIFNTFTRHRVACDVLMLIFFLCGLYALPQLSVRFFPPFEVKNVIVSVAMRGATSSEIEESVIVPLENNLRSVPDYDDLYSYSRENSGLIVLEFPENVDLDKAHSDVKTEVERVSLPDDAEAPLVEAIRPVEPVSRMTLVGAHVAELRQLARQIENELSAANLGKITVEGLPEEEIEVLVDQRKLLELDLSLAQVGQAIGAQNHDASVGKLTGLGNVRNIRADAKSAELSALLNLPVVASDDGSLVFLRDIATARRRTVDDQVSLLYNGQPAVSFTVTTSSGSVIATADRLNEWAEQKRTSLPESIRLVMHNETWLFVQSRIDLLVENGLSGIVIVLAVLFFFLTPRVALWVAAGIPVAMLGTLFVFYLFGGSINMISMFALIMAVGLIVDDSIVVAENALMRHSQGAPPMRAVISAAKTMFVPVVSSAFTTIASFLPLFLITGPVGAIIFDIPLIIVCILIVAVLECFLVLPGHLYRSFSNTDPQRANFVRKGIDRGFERFRQRIFRPIATFAVRHAAATVIATFTILFLSFALIANGIVRFRFFPNAAGDNLSASVTFNNGTPRAVLTAYLDELLAEMDAVDSELAPEQKLVEHVTAFIGGGGEFSPPGDHRALINIELIDIEQRSVTVEQFVAAWRARVREAPGIDNLEILAEQPGPPGRDIEINLASNDPQVNKAAAEELKEALRAIPDLDTISDDTSFGKEELVFELTPLGRSLNMNVSEVAAQLRHALDGFAVQSFTEGIDEVDLKVKMAGFSDEMIETLYLRLPNGQFAPLGEIVSWNSENSFDTIVHRFGQPTVTVYADLATTSSSSVAAVVASLRAGALGEISDAYGVSYTISGTSADEQQTGKEMMTGLVLASLLIYITLTLVFSSWSLPLIVMLTMPTGIIGAIIGHLILGLEMSILSFFGVFTLMGILVNNSIVLITCLQGLGAHVGDAKLYNAAIVEASVIRLRAVLLTSLTTIGGLLPLMFETSLQAQFLKPMAASICFGLATASLIILLFTPACLSVHGALQRAGARLSGVRVRIPRLISKGT